jgi:hypothetical protein
MSNSGVFDVNDIRYLMDYQQWTGVGTLELIETQTVTSSTAQVDFTNLSSYNVHFLTLNDFKAVNDGTYACMQFSNDGGSSFLTSGYQYAQQNGTSAGTFAENRSTSASVIFLSSSTGTPSNEVGNSYSYLYNLLDSSKYSFSTTHTTTFNSSATYEMWFGSGVKPTAETHNAIRVKCLSGNISKATISLYGIRYS